MKTSKPWYKIIIPFSLFFLLGTIVILITTFIITDTQEKADKSKFDNQINQLFNDKNEICDFEKTKVQGKLKQISLLDKIEVFSKPDIYNNLVEFFKCEGGGFKVLTLKRLNNEFKMLETESTDMGFKVPEFRHVEEKDFGYNYKIPGYDVSTGRGSVESAYNDALEYFTKDKADLAYTPGVYERIETFDEMQTDFYQLHRFDGTEYKDKGTPANFSISNDSYTVWVKEYVRYYSVIENHELFNKRWILFAALGESILIIILSIVFWFKSNY